MLWGDMEESIWVKLESCSCGNKWSVRGVYERLCEGEECG